MAGCTLRLVGAMVNDGAIELDDSDNRLRAYPWVFMMCGGAFLLDEDDVPPLRVFVESNEVSTSFKTDTVEIVRYSIADLDLLQEDAYRAEAEANEGAESVVVELVVGSLPFCFAYVHWLATRVDGANSNTCFWLLRHLLGCPDGNVVWVTQKEGFKSGTFDEMAQWAFQKPPEE